MKNTLIIILFFISCELVFSNPLNKPINQNDIEGIYVNTVNQTLVIRNVTSKSFEFIIDWGEGPFCRFEESGIAYIVGNEAYFESIDHPLIIFYIYNNEEVKVETSYYYVGLKCITESDINSEEFAVFLKDDDFYAD